MCEMTKVAVIICTRSLERIVKKKNRCNALKMSRRFQTCRFYLKQTKKRIDRLLNMSIFFKFAYTLMPSRGSFKNCLI